MSESTIRAAIKEVLTAVENIGTVHDYERHAADWGKFIELFRANDGKIRGWEITRRQVTGQQQTLGLGFRESDSRHVYKIRGYMGLQDAAASELAFNALIEAIRAAFAAAGRLGGNSNHHDFVQVGIIEPRMFGAVLCHFCEMTLTVTEPA